MTVWVNILMSSHDRRNVGVIVGPECRVKVHSILTSFHIVPAYVQVKFVKFGYSILAGHAILSVLSQFIYLLFLLLCQDSCASGLELVGFNPALVIVNINHAQESKITGIGPGKKISSCIGSINLGDDFCFPVKRIALMFSSSNG